MKQEIGQSPEWWDEASDVLTLEPPAGWLEAPGASRFLQVPDCPCCQEPPAPEPVRWAIPGVWGADAADPVRPVVSVALAALDDAVTRIEGTDPTDQPGPQALVDVDLLLALEQRLRRHKLRMLADLRTRKLHSLDGAGSTRAWLAERHPDTNAPDVTMSDRLRRYPLLRRWVLDGGLLMDAGRRVLNALDKARPHLDRADGLVDGQPAGPVIDAVITNTVDLIMQATLGAAQDDARLVGLLAAVADLQASADTELGKLEGSFVLLASNVPAPLLANCLSQQLDALLPGALEDRANRADRNRGLDLRSDDDQVGGDATLNADAELWELLHTVLGAESRRDPANPGDTSSAEQLRALTEDEEGADWALVDGVRHPRTRRQRLHDGLKLALQHYLDAGLGGSHDKSPVNVTVTVPSSLLEAQPGALPAVGGSGKTLPASLLRRWWCNAQVTAMILTAGWVALGTVHTQRTLTAAERKAARVQHRGQCAGTGCCRASDPLVHLVPHHVARYTAVGTTALGDTILACARLHHDLHHGKTIKLRNNQWLNEAGWTDNPHLPWRNGDALFGQL